METGENKEVIEEPKAYESQSPVHTDADVESGDVGIKHQANPLSRQLQGRHMQMIAIGKYMILPSLCWELDS